MGDLRTMEMDISEMSSFLRYADSIVLCPMAWLKTMATAYPFKELVSNRCQRMDLKHFDLDLIFALLLTLEDPPPECSLIARARVSVVLLGH